MLCAAHFRLGSSVLCNAVSSISKQVGNSSSCGHSMKRWIASVLTDRSHSFLFRLRKTLKQIGIKVQCHSAMGRLHYTIQRVFDARIAVSLLVSRDATWKDSTAPQLGCKQRCCSWPRKQSSTCSAGQESMRINDCTLLASVLHRVFVPLYSDGGATSGK